MPWVAKARQDLNAARSLLNDRQAPAAIGFHCQQAVEKILKAYLISCREPFVKVHDLDYLVTLGEKHEPALAALRPELATLDPFAVAFRYPTVHEPDRAAAEAAVQLARRVVEDVEGLILARIAP